MDVDVVLEESLEMSGPLGAVAFVVLKALDLARAPEEEVGRVRQALFRHFAELTDEQCNLLAEVAHRRLADRPTDGRWYGADS